MAEYLIRVVIEERRGGRQVAEACVGLNDTMQNLIQPLKQSDAGLPIFDTPDAVVRMVKRSRDNYAKEMTPKLAKLLLDALSANDTFNGYTKAENRQFYEPPTKDAK